MDLATLSMLNHEFLKKDPDIYCLASIMFVCLRMVRVPSIQVTLLEEYIL